MFYTITMNPAIDLVIQLDDLINHAVNRSCFDDVQANGKGVNVSVILKQLNVETLASGFIAGFTGNYICDVLHEKGISNHFIKTDGTTRINVIATTQRDEGEYRIINQGAFVSQEKQEELLNWLKEVVTCEDTICISGSLPKGVEPTFLVELVKAIRQLGAKVAIDTSYKEVLDCLKYGVDLVKPNEDELATWFNTAIDTFEAFIVYAKKLNELGAKQVLLSLGEKGALYVTKEVCYYVNAPKGKVVNTACAGDTLLATFLAQQYDNKPIEETLKMAVAAGTSTAFRVGLTTFDDVQELMTTIKVKTL